MRLHDANRVSFHCSFSDCKKSLLSAQSLENHERTHSAIKPFTCQECNRAFATPTNLAGHTKVHKKTIEEVVYDPQRPHICTECKKTFRHTIYLKKHKELHCGQRYSCGECNVSFLSKSYIKIHKRTHTGEMPHSCPMCMKTFAQSSHLNSHLKKHPEEDINI